MTDISKEAAKHEAQMLRQYSSQNIRYSGAIMIEAQAARIAELEAKAATVREKAERAYGLLWMVLGDDTKVHDARHILLDQIDRDGQQRGITYAKTQYETPDIMSVLHKLP